MTNSDKQFNFDMEYFERVLMGLLNIDSPTGFTQKAMKKVCGYAEELGLEVGLNKKGNAIITLSGADQSKTIGVCAHIDTLGFMVRSIKDNGMLALTRVGSPLIPTLDGEYCRIYTRENGCYTGTILSNSPSAHVYADASELARNIDNIEVRIDERVSSKEDVKKLGISNGDFVCIDTKSVITPAGFIKSRFLDDKLSVALVFCVLRYFLGNKVVPDFDIKILISSYEEIGSGMACIPPEISELIAVDMGCIGEDLSCTEFEVSICAKDSEGPYDYEITGELIQLAKENNISYSVDIYPYYASDISAALSGGNDISGALIGPGVHASHGMERSHMDAVKNTMKLLAAYLQKNRR